MRATTKGQVTIPLAIRRALGIDPTTELEFELRGDEAVLRVKCETPEERGRRIVERLWGRGNLGMTTDEWMAMTRGEDWNQASPS
jgi:AbrB family looped-hinge helix DNA binding protein